MPIATFTIDPLPIKTDRTLRAVPYVTYALCFANIYVYLQLLGESNYTLAEVRHQWGFIIAEPSLTTLFTHAFLHTDLLHLLSNMFILWLVGTVLECGIGSLVFLLLYLASLVASCMLFGLIGRVFLHDSLNVPLIGASGAISGITGLATFRYFRLRVWTIMLFSTPWVPLPIPLPIPIWLPLWMYGALFAVRNLVDGIMMIVQGRSEVVAYWAHIGGVGLGMLLALLMRVAEEGRREFVLEETTRAASGEAPKEYSLKELKRLLRQQPNDPELLEAMAGLMMARGEHELSRDLYLKAIRIFLAGAMRERAAVAYLNVLRTAPRTLLSPREQITLASALEAQGHYEEAVQAFMLIVDHYGEREEAQTALLRTSQIYLRYLKNPGTAERLLHQLLEHYPDSSWRTLVHERLREIAAVATITGYNEPE